MRLIYETLAKAFCCGSLAGALVFWRVESRQADESVTAWIKEFLGWPVNAVNAAFDLFNAEWIFQASHDWLLGQALPLTAGVVVFAKVSLILFAPIRNRPLVDYFWPSAPDILDPRMEEVNFTSGGPKRCTSTFVGREAELRNLMRFAGASRDDSPAFMMLSGREGLGKTRLGLEWLKRLRTLGWDVGCLETLVTPLDVKRANFRRKTAILIDDASQSPKIWTILDELLKKKQNIRILVVDLASMSRPESLDADVQSRIDSADSGLSRLSGLADDSLAALAPALSPRAYRQADGRPLYVLLGDDPVAEVRRRAAKRLELVEGHSERVVLLAGALAGPVAHEKLDTRLGINVSISALERMFDGEERRVLKKVLPAISPDFFADEIILCASGDMTDSDLATLVAGVTKSNGAAVERRLASLWRRNGLNEQASEIRLLIQETFDRVAQERVRSLRNKISTHVDLVSLSNLKQTPENLNADDIFKALTVIGDCADSRPFDPRVRLAEAHGAASALFYYGSLSQIEDMRYWGIRLKALIEIFPADRAFAVCEAIGASNAIGSCAKFEWLDDLRDWEQRLLAVSQANKGDLEIQINVAQGLVNGIYYHGFAQRFDELERWGELLLSSAEGLESECEYQFERTLGFVNATAFYGRLGQFENMERWAAQVLAATSECENELKLQLNEARAADNVILSYGNAGKLDDLECWGERLLKIVSKSPSDPEIQLNLATGAANAVDAYLSANEISDAERWAGHLAIVAKQFPRDPAIKYEEARCLLSIMTFHLKAGKLDEMERLGRQMALIVAAVPEDAAIAGVGAMAAYNASLSYSETMLLEDMEGWGQRVISIGADFQTNRDIRFEEVKCAYNAILAYGRAGKHGNVVEIAWRERLKKAAEDFVTDADIQEVCSRLNLGVVSQRLTEQNPDPAE